MLEPTKRGIVFKDDDEPSNNAHLSVDRDGDLWIEVAEGEKTPCCVIVPKISALQLLEIALRKVKEA